MPKLRDYVTSSGSDPTLLYLLQRSMNHPRENCMAPLFKLLVKIGRAYDA